MNEKQPGAIAALLDALRALPGVGPKSAARMAYHLLQRDRAGAEKLAATLGHALTLFMEEFMSIESNKAHALGWHEALNSPDWETAIVPFFTGDLALYQVWFIQNHRQFRKAFPDYHANVTRVVAEDDTVVVVTLVTGTHSAEFPFGELKGIAATRGDLRGSVCEKTSLIIKAYFILQIKGFLWMNKLQVQRL